MVSVKMISKFTILVADIRNTEKIYGPSNSSLNGKSTRRKPRPVIKDDIQITIQIYQNNLKQYLCIGIVYIYDISIIVSTDIQVKYRSIIHIISQTEEEFSIDLEKYF